MVDWKLYSNMNAYETGFLDGLKEALRLMEQEWSIDFGPGKILKKIEQLTGVEHTGSTPSQPSFHTSDTDP